MIRYSPKAFGKRERITVIASWTHLGTTCNRIPSCVCPLNSRFITHLKSPSIASHSFKNDTFCFLVTYCSLALLDVLKLKWYLPKEPMFYFYSIIPFLSRISDINGTC